MKIRVAVPENEIVGEAFRDSLMTALLCDGFLQILFYFIFKGNLERETQRR